MPTKKIKSDHVVKQSINSMFSNDDSDSNLLCLLSTQTTSNMSALEQIKKEQERKNIDKFQQEDHKNRKEYWLHIGIIVKIKNKKLKDGLYFNQKGIVTQLIDNFVGDIELDDGSVIRLDQEDLETVIPKVGGRVMIINGYGRGKHAIIMKVNTDSFNCNVKLEDGSNMEITKEYEDFSKAA